ncbi:MAG: T9SS type A sorting domain-containing protein [candidate division Zixibacteria bacterium]|nr:T9SS type A sorting domain-containing protein [candidate division Zixibacteria bacterium]
MKRRGSHLNLVLLTLVWLIAFGVNATAQSGSDSLVVGDPECPPTVTLPDDSLVVWCVADSICYDISAWDPDESDSILMSLVSGPITYEPQRFGSEFTTTVCFWPESSGEYEFIWQFKDRQAHIVIDTVVYTIEIGSIPVIEDQQFFSELCDLRTERYLSQIYSGAGSNPLFELLSGPGTIDPATGLITYQPDTSGTFVFEVSLTGICGSDTATLIDELVLNLPPHCIGFDSTIFLCDLEEICFDIFATDPEGDVIEISMLEGLGIFEQTSDTSGRTCFVPADVGYAQYVFIYRSADSCVLQLGEALSEPYCCIDTVRIDVHITQPGELTCPTDTTYDLCVPPDELPALICLDGFISTWETTTISFGTLNADTLCFEADTLGTYTIDYIGTDTCGHTDTCTTLVTVKGNNTPYVTMADDYSIDLCVPETICFAATADDLDFDIADISVNYGYFDQSSGRICFDADSSGVYVIIMTATDECGASDTDSTIVTIDLNQPPTVSLGEDQTLDLCQIEEICIDAIVTGNRINFFSTSTGAYYNEATSQVCFTPQESGTYEVFLQVEDDCDNVVADTILVNVTIGSAPTISGFADSSVYVCYPVEICLPLEISDIDGDIATITVNQGQYRDGYVCFTPYSMGNYELIVTVTDECGYQAVDTAYLDVQTDQDIELVCPGDTTVFLCEPDTLCFPIGGIPEGAEVSVDGLATYWNPVTESVCFFSDCCLENKVTVSVTTECGIYSCDFNVSVQTNSRPLVMLPTDTTIFLCDPGPICLPVGISDIDGNIAGVTVTGGTYDDYENTVCFDALEETTYIINVEVIDSCGAVVTDEMAVTIKLNVAPTVDFLPTDSVKRLCELGPISFGLEYEDLDGHELDFGWESTNGMAMLVMGIPDSTIIGVNYVPNSYGDHCITLWVTDPCGLADTTKVCFTLVQPEPVAIMCPEPTGAIMCGQGTACFDIPITGDVLQVSTSLGTWADGQLCIDAEVSLFEEVTIIADGECNSDTCTVPISIDVVEAPIVECQGNVDILLCGPDTLVLPVTLVAGSGPQEELTAVAPAWITRDAEGAWVHLPITEPGEYTVTVVYSSPPCPADTCSFTVAADFNTPPELTADNISFDLCLLESVTIPFAYYDLEDNIVDITSPDGLVTYSNGTGELQFTPDMFGEFLVTLTAVDECGEETSITINVTINELPVVEIGCPASSVFCDPGPHCIDLPIFGDATVVTPEGTTWADGQFCIDLTDLQYGTYAYTIIAEGPCNSDTCTVEVKYLAPVGVTCVVLDTTITVCSEANSTVLMPVDITGDEYTVSVIPEYPLVDSFVEVPIDTAGLYPVSIMVQNECSIDACNFVVNIDLNSAPDVSLGVDTTITLCELIEICVPYEAYDADADLLQLESLGGVITDGTICFTPDSFGDHEIIITATDPCLAMDEDTIVVSVVQGQFVTMTCPDPVMAVDVDLPDTVRVPVGVDPLDVDVTVAPYGYYDYSTGEAVIYLESEGLHQFVVTAVADCNADSCEFALEVGQYIPPYVDCIGTVDTLLCLSRPRELCLPVSVFGTDVQVEVSDGAVFTGDAVCFEVSAPGEYVIDILAYTDRDSATCQSIVTVTGGNPPILEMPEFLDYTLCGSGDVCFDVVMEDAEFDITNISLNFGNYDINTGQVCFFADTAGTYIFDMTVADSCDNETSGSTTVAIAFNEAPVVELGDDFEVFGCVFEEICVDVTITDDDDVTVYTSLGQYDPITGQVCFLPETSGTYELIVEATDLCGVTAADTVNIQVRSNTPPEMAPLRDTTVYICYPISICLDALISDPDGNLVSVETSLGTYENDQVCFVPYSMGEYEIIVTATDECGATVIDTALVTILTDQDIELVCPGDTTVFLCEPDTLCFPIGGIPEGAEVSVGGLATYWNPVTESVCFFSDCCLENKVTVSVTTQCGTYSCDFNVSVQTNSRPLVMLPTDITIMQCQFEEICLPVGIDDIDGNITSVQVDGGSYDDYANVICFTPDQSGSYTLTVTAIDSCGAVGTDEVVVDVVLNEAPIITYQPIDTLYKQCVPEEICVSIGIADVNGNIVDISVTGGHYDADLQAICILPEGFGTFCANVTVTDNCGLTATEQVCVEVIDGDYVEITCNEFPDSGPDLCQPETVCYPLVVSGDNFMVSTDFGTWENDQLCFFADTSGTYVITVIADAMCISDTCVVTVPITILEPLAVTCPEDDTQFLCGSDTLCYDFSYRPLSAEVTVSAPAYLNGGQVCVPVFEPGTQTITLTAANHCGEVQCSFDVTATFNEGPTVDAGEDVALVECDLHEICLPVYFSDADSNIRLLETSLGVLSGDTAVCFTPPDFGEYEFILTVTDECDETATDKVVLSYTEGLTASIMCPDGAQYASICDPDKVCILAPITDAETITILPGGVYKPETGEVCVYVTEGGTFPITIIAESQCGSDTCNFNLEVDMGVAPVVECPEPIDTVLCLVETDTLRLPITVSGTGLSVNVNPAGYYAAGILNLPISEPGEHIFEVIAYGSCGADTCEVTVTVTADEAPVLTLPTELTFERCPDDIDEICIDGIFATDLESDVEITQVCGPGLFSGPTLDSGAVCFVPEAFGQIEFCFEATDGCHVITGSFLVNIVTRDDCDVCVRFEIDGGGETPVGLRKRVDINVETNEAIGGFDLLIGFDVSALSFQYASMDGGVGESWEYFTWNVDDQSCGSACPSGLVRFVGIADRNNGAAHPPDSAYTPDGSLFFVEFQVANDQNLGDVFVPISFVWYDCADNAVSDTTGTLLFIDTRIYNAEHILIWDEFDDVNYPESVREDNLGAPDSCVVIGEKSQAVRCIEFINGGIKIIDPGDIDDRGDINLNNIAYEIADAVVFTNYFIHGLSAFTISIPGQIAASDVNADGLTLTVADLTLLIRVIIGDANPIPKTTPYDQVAGIHTSRDVDRIRVSAETYNGIGAAYFVYDVAPGLSFGEPQTLAAADGFTVKSGVSEGKLRILVYNIGSARIAPGLGDLVEIPVYGDGELTLTHSEIVDYQSRPYVSLIASTLPAEYNLKQNYPNPFNPATTISFALPTAATWSLKVYNITGALVWEHQGRSEGGLVDVVWDGHNLSGDAIASGVYFYRLDANNYSNTRKMILLK